jgi:hypothetical protein
MYLSELTRRLCSGQDLYPFVLQNKKKLAWTIQYAKHLDFTPGNDDVITSNTLRAVWTYIEKFQSLPKSPADVKGYVINNPHNIKEFARGEGEKDNTPGILEQLDLLETWKPTPASLETIDALLLLEMAFSDVRNNWHERLYNRAAKIASGAEPFSYRVGLEKKEERGPAAAVRSLRMAWLRDYTDEAPPQDGMLHENMQSVREGFANLMDENTVANQMPIGIEHIDKNIVISKQSDMKFIGIIGQSGDGKTTLANHIVYRWLRQGFNGLYASTEHSSKHIWDAMTYLHSSHPDYAGMVLPGTKAWESRHVTPEDISHMQDICRDIETRKNLPGMLEVKEFRPFDWDTIEDWVKVYHARNHYDFILLDYITRFEIPGEPKWIDQEIRRIIHRIQRFTRNFDDGRGMVVVSPIQITKESYKDAMKGEFKEGQGHYTIDSIRTFSELKDDCDLLLTVWSEDDMKMEGRNEVEVSCVKKRIGSQPPARIMKLSPNTGAFIRKGEEPEAGQQPLTPELAEKVREIRNIDSDTVDEMPQY